MDATPRLVRAKSGKYYPPEHWGIELPVKGAVYVIRGVVEQEGEIGLHLVGLTYPQASDGRELSISIRRFRPLIDRSQEQDVALFQCIADAAIAHMAGTA